MKTISVDLGRPCGKIKPMHSVNNGPVYKFTADQRITNLDAYRDAGIPYARVHDASYCAHYGGEHTVDVNMIFTDFDADPYDPASYDFQLTDDYMRVIDHAGTKVFYRLGSKIEHWSKKYNTLPPKDFKKWAVICEQIIRHLNEGWANGLHLGIKYWEIWNEPDLDTDDSDHKRTWGGTKASFFDFYEVAAKYLKQQFPHLKIGGPALAFRLDWAKDFLKEMKKRNAPMDFFSYHIYADKVENVQKMILDVDALLNETGWAGTETNLNEWNYIAGWENENFVESIRAIKGIRGATFTASTMLMAQKSPLDHLMYYDARPSGYSGLFSTDLVCDCLKTYYAFTFFNTLYRLGTEVGSDSDANDLRVVAATGEGGSAVMLSYYDPTHLPCADEVKIHINGLSAKDRTKVEFFVLDAEHDAALIRCDYVCTDEADFYLPIQNETTYLVKLTAL